MALFSRLLYPSIKDHLCEILLFACHLLSLSCLYIFLSLVSYHLTKCIRREWNETKYVSNTQKEKYVIAIKYKQVISVVFFLLLLRLSLTCCSSIFVSRMSTNCAVSVCTKIQCTIFYIRGGFLKVKSDARIILALYKSCASLRFDLWAKR